MNFIDGEKLIKKGADISETKKWDDGPSKNSNEKLPLIIQVSLRLPHC